MNQLVRRRLLRAPVLQTWRLVTTGRKSKKFSVDRSGLVSFTEEEVVESDTPTASSKVTKESLSPLAKDLQSYIKLKGPISLHDYMAQSLNHLVHGYYQGKGEVIGEEGDFITAPEVSQLFGEMIGIWCLSMWEKMGKPDKLYIVELGPGKGTLMKDVMRVAARFQPFASAVLVHFVELSTVLRGRQYNALRCTGASTGTTTTAADGTAGAATGKVGELSIKEGMAYPMESGIKAHWHSFLQQVPSDAPALIIGQEFLDAFPVHQFCYTERGWREKLVDVNAGAAPVSKKPSVATTNTKIAAAKREVLGRSQPLSRVASVEGPGEQTVPSAGVESGVTAGSAYHFRFVLSPSQTPAVKSLLVNRQDSAAATSNASANSSSSGTTTTQPSTASADTTSSTPIPAPKVGDGMEISPLALATCEDIALRVVACGGAALLVDYGEDFTQEDTLRAYLKHKQVSVLSQPGSADMTADVDFSMCRRAALKKGAQVPPLLTQGEFLMRMGILARVQQLVELDETSDEQASALVDSLKYLVEGSKMGTRFKVMSIANPALGAVTGFES